MSMGGFLSPACFRGGFLLSVRFRGGFRSPVRAAPVRKGGNLPTSLGQGTLRGAYTEAPACVMVPSCDGSTHPGACQNPFSPVWRVS